MHGSIDASCDHRLDHRLSYTLCCVQVRAAALNPMDIKMPTFFLIGRAYDKKPTGIDFAGDVVEVGPGSAYKPGDRVYGCVTSTGTSTGGPMVEYFVAPEAEIGPMPTTATYAEAASLACVGVTAIQAFRLGDLKAGQHVLIAGASGGVGSAAIQVAKGLGVKVTGLCSSANAAFVKSLGADAVIDYNDAGAMATLGKTAATKFDRVLDAVPDGGAPAPDYESMLRPSIGFESTYIAINPKGALDAMRALTGWSWLQRMGYRVLICVITPADLKLLADMFDAGKVKAVLHDGKTLPLTDEGVHAAFKLLRSKRAKGKLVIDIDNANAN